jgi:hypothetical protein
MKKNNKKKTKIVYLEDKGETIYSMAPLDGKTPKEREEEEKKRKVLSEITGRERLAMIGAAFQVYGPLLLMFVGAFTLVAIGLFLFLR